ncbi:MAG: outer membrane beta-barrel protein [Candidatus Marinimicrobia bacterium]|nr:outer membrane beta-barrel protein [Candidatus Neomarinimicrobiota bacterium]
MKNIITTVIATILLFTSQSPTFAQNRVGLKIGMVNANQSWEYSTSGLDLGNESRPGIDVGVFYRWYDAESFRILSELRYVQKGIRADFLNTTSEQIVTLEPRADYLTIAPLIQKTIPIWINPYILAGPRLDVLLGTNSEQFFETYDKLRFLDFGVSLGAGFDFPFSNQVFFLTEFRYEPSFINAYQSDNLEIRNTAFSVLVGLSYIP